MWQWCDKPCFTSYSTPLTTFRVTSSKDTTCKTKLLLAVRSFRYLSNTNILTDFKYTHALGIMMIASLSRVTISVITNKNRLWHFKKTGRQNYNKSWIIKNAIMLLSPQREISEVTECVIYAGFDPGCCCCDTYIGFLFKAKSGSETIKSEVYSYIQSFKRSSAVWGPVINCQYLNAVFLDANLGFQVMSTIIY